MKKIAYVVPTFPKEIDEIRKNEQNRSFKIVNNIISMFKIDVITTCATQGDDFTNVCIPGIYEEENYKVIRFLIENTDQKLEKEKLLEELSEEEWYRIIRSQGGYSPELFNYIHRMWRKYDAVVFFGIDYWPTIVGMYAIQNAIIIPNISSKNIRYACSEIYRSVFKQIDYAICFEEREYALFKNLNLKKVCVSESLDISPALRTIVEEMSFKEQSELENADIEKEILYSAKLEPAFENSNIPIVLASDNNYVHLLCVALQSIIDSASIDNNYDFIILSDKISYKARKNIYHICAEYSNIRLRFIEVSVLLEHNEFSFRCQQLSRAAFARLLLPELLDKYGKIVYLDCDILARIDIVELFNVDLCNSFVGAIEDPFVAVLRKNRDKEKKHISLHVGKKMDEKYFNSGVLVMNLDMFRKYYTSKQMFSVATQRTWMWEDQDVLNKLCRNQVVWLPINWNYLWGREEIVRDLMKLRLDYFEGYYNPYIIHYAGGCTPLRSINDEYEVEFWNVARKTPYYELLLADMIRNRFKVQNWMQACMGANPITGFSENVSKKYIIMSSGLAELSQGDPVAQKGVKGWGKKVLYKLSRCIFVPFATSQTIHNQNLRDILNEMNKVKEVQQEQIDDSRKYLMELCKVLNSTDKK